MSPKLLPRAWKSWLTKVRRSRPEVVDGVENAPLADEGERIIRERPETPNENVPDEEEPGERRS